MRLSMIIAVLLIACSTALAQDLQSTQVPKAVLKAFNKDFPEAMDVEWKLKGTRYKVEFQIGLVNNEHDAWYNSKGKLLKHEEEILSADLPEAVASAIAQDFPGYRIDDAERVTTNGEIGYSVELKMKGEEWDVVYDEKGNQLQMVQD